MEETGCLHRASKRRGVILLDGTDQMVLCCLRSAAGAPAQALRRHKAATDLAAFSFSSVKQKKRPPSQFQRPGKIGPSSSFHYTQEPISLHADPAQR